MANQRLHIGLLLFYVLLCSGSTRGQDRSNPFEITSRLPEVAQGVALDSANSRAAGTPFDIRGQGAGTVASAPGPAPAAAPDARQSGPLVIQSSDPNRGRGAVLAIQLILLVALASLWVLFGRLLTQVLRGTLNDSLMNQIYTRRSGGEESALWVCYLFFFLAAGFYLHLFTGYHGISLNLNIWLSWGTYALAVAALVGLKQVVVATLGSLFPIRKETSKYAFVLMVFSILIGILLVPINLGVSYAPEGARGAFLYGGLALVALVYLLHLMRALLVAGPLVSMRPLHLVLYICAVEIAPLLLFYRYLYDTLL